MPLFTVNTFLKAGLSECNTERHWYPGEPTIGQFSSLYSWVKKLRFLAVQDLEFVGLRRKARRKRVKSLASSKKTTALQELHSQSNFIDEFGQSDVFLGQTSTVMSAESDLYLKEHTHKWSDKHTGVRKRRLVGVLTLL